ncbi:ferric-chelate reductase Frp1 [Savitreella phatthalungensis]
MKMDMDMGDRPLAGASWASETYAKAWLATVLISCALVGGCRWLLYWRTAVRRSPNTGPLHSALQLAREATYFQSNGFSCAQLLGCGAYIVILLSFLLSDVWSSTPVVFWEAIAFRAAYLTVAQMPLLFALSTKRNILAFVLHTTYGRLNVFHRLAALCTLTTATIHMGYFLREWTFYDIFYEQWSIMGMSMLRWGFAAWGLLIFLVATAYLTRERLHDAWLWLHISSAVSFLVMTWLHLDPPYRGWIYGTLAIWAVDRLMRGINLLACSLSGPRAQIKQLDAVLEITVSGANMTIRPSQHVLLTIPSLGPGAHPLTLLPREQPTFVVKIKRGWTRRLANWPEKSLTCALEGPYAGSHLPPRAFAATTLICGGTGGSWTHAVLQNLLQDPGHCRRVVLIEVYRRSEDTAWYERDRAIAMEHARGKGIMLEICIYLTSAQHGGSEKAGLRIIPGRPSFACLLDRALPWCEGESAIYCCGPPSLCDSVRHEAVVLSDSRAAKKGLGAEAIYVHIENQ